MYTSWQLTVMVNFKLKKQAAQLFIWEPSQSQHTKQMTLASLSQAVIIVGD